MEQRIQFELKDYVRLEMLGIIKSPAHEECGPHKHPFWELIFSVSGEDIHRIGSREFSLPQGTMCLIPPEVEHACENRLSEENVKLYIDFSFSTSFSPQQPGQSVASGERIEANILGFDLFSLAEALEKRTDPPEDLHTEKLISALSCLAIYLQDDRCEQLSLQELRQQTITEKIIDYLQHNINRSVRVEELASMFYLSPYYISDQFRKRTGVGIKQYHENLRMYHALQRLKERKYSITEIAEELGYENIHYFSRRFKAHFGYPPSHITKNSEFVQTHF